MKASFFVLVVAAALALAPGALAGGKAPVRVQAQANQYVVLYTAATSLAAARLAVQAAGGLIVKENTDVGVATVSSTNPRFLADVAAQSQLAGAARDAPVGREAPLLRPRRDDVERLTQAERAAAKADRQSRAAQPNADPLAGLQWDLALIHATTTGSYARQPGSRGVRVGIIDTGVDGTHPDIAPNFDGALSRNFTTDIPSVDGPCEFAGCVDPANVDDNSHGTHVAGTIGAALNGIGMAGIAPNVTLVNIRAGQDSGYFFLQATVDALTYAGNNGIDVVNMSYFIDPWLYNCAANPADSAEQQLEQRTIVAATNRALDYAYAHGVTLIAALGNEHTDIGHPTADDISPDYPPGSERHRIVDNSCLTMPTEGNHVIGVGAVGPSTMKADYSNWGVEQTKVTAPGGYYRDYAGTPQNRTVGNLVLSAYPKYDAEANGDLNPDGTPNNPFVVRDCNGGVCAYYQYAQGTSMASPHAVGVAALIISQYGHPDQEQGNNDGNHGNHDAAKGLTMRPADVERILLRTATKHPCPTPPLIDYTIPGRDRSPAYNALCEGSADFNSIWGNGIVDALAAVGGARR